MWHGVGREREPCRSESRKRIEETVPFSLGSVDRGSEPRRFLQHILHLVPLCPNTRCVTGVNRKPSLDRGTDWD